MLICTSDPTHTHTHTLDLSSCRPNLSFPRLISFLAFPQKSGTGRYLHSLGRGRTGYIKLSHKIGFKIIFLCQDSLDYFLPELTLRVCLQETNFYSLPSLQHWPDVLCYVLWIHSGPILKAKCFTNSGVFHPAEDLAVQGSSRLLFISTFLIQN